MKKMQVVTGLVLSGLLALSLIASVGQAFFASQSTGGDNAGLVARGKGQGVTWQDITWE